MSKFAIFCCIALTGWYLADGTKALSKAAELKRQGA